jgi:flavodoxin/formate hydrogenlyase subunit 6/NADH:ubiquinone oxidoreductase subunit I
MRGRVVVKSIIIYFSQTGNTKKVAQAIHKGTSQRVELCDIAKMKEVSARDLIEYDLIGLGSPVWGGPPPNLKFFIDTLTPLSGKHIFAFCTHGALPQNFSPMTVRLLEKKGLIVIGMGDWYGTVFMPPFPKPYFTDGHPDEVDLKEAEQFGKEMVELSRRISTGEIQLIPPQPKMQRVPKRPPGLLLRPKLHIQKCRYPKCHLCMDHCPVDAIDLSVSPPVFAKSCRPCYFCEMICPEGAIEVDYDVVAKATRWRAKQVYSKALDKAEAEGRFRRLVSKEDVDWDIPRYRVYKKHPRYVIPIE